MNNEIIMKWSPILLQGLGTTIAIWLYASAISLGVGGLVGILRCRRLRVPILSRTLDVVTFLIRGVPFYVQLLIAYFVLPELLGINWSPKMAGIISLGLCSSAYISQMVRGGINAIADEQWDAAFVLGLKNVHTLRFLIVPQSLRTIVPMLCGELDQLLKSTSIISAIGVLELTRAGMNIIAVDMQIVATYTAIAMLYLLLSSLLNLSAMTLERKMAYDLR